MQLHAQKFSLAAAITAGVAYVACAVFVALFPDFSLQLVGWLAHVVNVEKFAGDVAITFSGVLIGLVEVVIYVYLFAWLFAWLYNKFVTSAPASR